MIKRLALGLACVVFLTACSSIPGMHKAPADKLGWKLGCQAWTFRKMTLTETLTTLHGLGIHYIEIYPGQKFSPEKGAVIFDHNASDDLVAEFLAKCKAADVKPVSYGVVQLGKDEAQARKVFNFGKKLGLWNIVSEPSEEALPMLDTLANEYGINVAIHDHPKPSHYWDCKVVREAVRGRSQRIGACADVGHWYRSGLVPVDCLKMLEGHIIEFHFKDIDTKKEDVPWGTGECNVPAMLEEIKRQKIHGVMSIEYETGEGDALLVNVRKCIEYFNAQADRLAKE